MAPNGWKSSGRARDLAYVVVGSFSVSRHPSGANEVFTYSYVPSEQITFKAYIDGHADRVPI